MATKLALEHGARVIVNIASVAGDRDDPTPLARIRRGEGRADPVYDRVRRPGARELHRARLDRYAPREAEAMPDAGRAAAGPMVAMETITAAVSDLLADDTARGRVVVLR